MQLDAHLFMLEGVDLVLGISWLKSLGDMVINWEKQTMQFWKEGGLGDFERHGQ